MCVGWVMGPCSPAIPAASTWQGPKENRTKRGVSSGHRQEEAALFQCQPGTLCRAGLPAPTEKSTVPFPHSELGD